jgi:hypothetical protein
MLKLNSSRPGARFVVLALIALSTLILSSVAGYAQTTVAQGSIQGTVTDPTGAAVPGAKVTIQHRSTGQTSTTITSSSGTYNSGGLIPGEYVVRVEARGFKTSEVPVTVQVTVTASGNVKLEIGQESQVIEVQGSTVTVNTEQATVQGVLTSDQIDKLPIDGRNFLDLAQLEPGVQIQDGSTFDPTKAGYSSVSINGVFGRTPRIELDGLDISDETVGTTTQNIGMGSIQEFNISRSFLDLSTELTSAGAVNVTTRSGTNAFHGQAFYNFRDRNALTADFPGAVDSYYQRNNFGGRFGGPIWKDKLFFFLDAERMKQAGLESTIVSAPFSALSGGFPSPFFDTELTGKLDWQASKNIHVFYRFTLNWNKSAATYYSGYPVYLNRDNTPSDAVGVDWNKGSWSHSFRGGYLKFHNQIVDGTQGSTFYNPLPRDGVEFADIGFLFGPNLLAPQGTFQSDKQIKYDGSKVWKDHIFRFGVGSNRIEGGGFASFFGTAPLLVSVAAFGSLTGATSDPTSYPLLEALLGNGQGYFTEKPGFGLPAGGQADWRFQWYVGDSWKIKSNFTLTYGLRYNRDTGRTDSDLSPIPCSQISASIQATGEAPCAGGSQILDQFGNTAGLGNSVRQPNTNYGPQVGFAWDPSKNGKTVIRAGAGLYYENSIFNNTLFDRPAKLAKGLFNAQAQLVCGSSTPGSVSVAFTPTQTVTSVDGKDLASYVCQQPLSIAGPLVADLQQQFQAAVSGQAISNPNYIGNSLTLTSQTSGLAAFDPKWRVPHSYQMNFGVQRQLTRGGVLSADFIRNVSLHFPLTIDVNHVGDARYLNVNAAKNAVANTLAACGVATIDAAIAACPGLYPTGGGATINDFASNGLDSGYAYFGGAPVEVASGGALTPNTGAAFAGINPLMGVGDIEEPIGRSVYNALQTSYKQRVENPFSGVAAMDLTVSYTLSRFEGNGGNDQNFSALAWDNANPTSFFGPTSLDRTHAFKFGATFNVAHRGPQFSVIGNFGSPHPAYMQLLTQDGNLYPGTGEIFRTDVTGDGSVADLFSPNGGPGRPGQLGRSISPGGLNNAINEWNNTAAGTLTPAGQALVANGLFTTAQLQSLQAVKPWVAPAPTGTEGSGFFKEVSTVFSWPIKLRESLVIEPSIGAFNVFNFHNFGIPTPLINDQSSGPFPAGTFGSAGSVTGTGSGSLNSRESLRTGTGSGVFSNGAPRQVEFGLKFNF